MGSHFSFTILSKHDVSLVFGLDLKLSGRVHTVCSRLWLHSGPLKKNEKGPSSMEWNDRGLQAEACATTAWPFGLSMPTLQNAVWAATWICSTWIPWPAGRQWSLFTFTKKGLPFTISPFSWIIFAMISVSSCCPHTMLKILRTQPKCQQMTCHCDCQAIGSYFSA